MLLAPSRLLAEVRAALVRRRPACVVRSVGRADHAMQVCAGLHALAREGLLRLAGRPAPDDAHGVLVELEGAGMVFFDVRDGPECYPLVAQVALYAKRSYHADLPPNCVPLGLNYAVHPRRAVQVARRLPVLYRLARAPAMDAREAAALPPRALFLARTWDASEVTIPQAELDALNDTRAECIRALRRRFKDRFLGGFAPSALAERRYPDCLAPPHVSTRRRDYLALLRGYPVGIATTGLSGSTGWKFAEYVALSRAIVCEPLRYELPGPIAAGSHYLPFTTPAECVERVGTLLEDAQARASMMRRNEHYWREFGAPAAVVARALHTALARA